MDKLTLTIEETAKELNIGRNLAYELARQGKIPTIRIGERRLLVPVDALRRMLNEASNEPICAR